MRGTIRSAWRRAAERFELTVEIPANVTATVILPATATPRGGPDAAVAPGVHEVRRENGRWIAEIGSGTYEFRCSR